MNSILENVPPVFAYAVAGAVVLSILVVVFLMARKASSLKSDLLDRTRREEQEFMDREIARFEERGSAPPAAQAPENAAWVPDPAEQPVAAGWQQPVTAPPALGGRPASTNAGAVATLGGESMNDWILNLQRLGILGAQEGTLQMPPPLPGAPIYSLRDGKRALLLESLESERFLLHHAQRFDFIFVRGTEGRPLVIRRMEDFVTEKFAGMRLQ